MTEVVASRMAAYEKRLVQALAARRQTLVGHLIRDLLLSEVRKEMGKDGHDREEASGWGGYT